MKIAVIVPCYNEALTIEKVIRDFKNYLPSATIYVFDNNSNDGTGEIARNAGATVIISRKQGKGHVVKHMFNVIEADYYIMVDGDDTYPAKDVSLLLTEAIENNVDMVVGSRLEEGGKKDFRPFHHFGNKLVSFLITNLFGCKIKDTMSGYRVFSRNFVKTIPLFSEGFDIETEMTLQALAKDFSIHEIPIKIGQRPEGSFSKLNTIQDGILVIKMILKIFKDYKPFFFFSYLALIFFLISVSAGSLPIYDYILYKKVYRFPLAILAMGMMTLSFLSFSVGLVLDTVTKYERENYELIKRLFQLKS